MKKKNKKSVTLLEMMIVIFLISLIGGAIGYNVKGSLEKGKAFKTEQAQKQINDILLLEHAQTNRTLEEIAEDAHSVLKSSGLVRDVDKIMKDGWNEKFDIKPKKRKKEAGFNIISKRYNEYKKQKAKK